MTSRRYALKPWLIRALIPAHVIGAYVLWSPEAPVYVGRSDTCLRRRLLEHSQNWPHSYFTYDVAFSTHDAYSMECSLFHALDRTANIAHPQRPQSGQPSCPFCFGAVRAARDGRLELLFISA
jgi:hypothetical protein